MLPKEFATTTAELDLDDAELDELLASLKRRVQEQRTVEHRPPLRMLSEKTDAATAAMREQDGEPH